MVLILKANLSIWVKQDKSIIFLMNKLSTYIKALYKIKVKTYDL